MYITLGKSGLVKQVKVGFSWTTFFFGLFVPLFRGDIKWAAIMFFSSLLLGFFTAGVGGLVVGLVFSFIYNKLYIKDLIEKGWQPTNEDAKQTLVAKGIII